MASKTEIIGVMRLLNQAYQSKQEITDELIDLWVAILGQHECNVLKAACIKLISENKFAPTIADINEQVKKLAMLTQPTAAEAWGLVRQSIKDYGYYEVSKGMECLPALVRHVVGLIGYTEICQSDKPGVVRRQFMDMYEQTLTREVEQRFLPAGVSEVAKQLAGKAVKALESGVRE